MKTNQIMIRNNSAFLQRTKDSYFSATDFLKKWNIDNPSKKKEVRRYISIQSTKKFIKQLQKENIEKPYISSNKGAWMHPKLFIDFAMWVSIEFKSIVIDYVLDGLIFNRHMAGDYYKEMSAAIMNVYVDYYKKKPPAMIYVQEAKLVKSLVTDKPRNEMNEHQLKQLTYLQKVNTNLIKKRIGKQTRIRRLKEAAEIQI